MDTGVRAPVFFAWKGVVFEQCRQEWKLIAGGREVILTGYAAGARGFLWKLKSRSRVKVRHLIPPDKT